MKQAILAKRKSLITLSLVLGLPHFAYAAQVTQWQTPLLDATQMTKSPYFVQNTWNALYYRLTGAATWTTGYHQGNIQSVSNNYAEFVLVEQNMNSITIANASIGGNPFGGKFGGFNFKSGTTTRFTIASEGELNSNYARGSLTQGFESGEGASLIVQSPATIDTLDNSGKIQTKTLIYGTISKKAD